jgi:hypothetical protein
MWIYTNISSNMDDVAVIPDDKAKEIFLEKMQQIISQEGFDELSEIGLITVGDIRLSDSTKATVTDIIDEYAEKIVPIMIDYLGEVRKKKIEYEKAYELFEMEIKRRKDVLSDKTVELSQQGVLAFSKKKGIRMVMEQLQKELEEYSTNGEPKKVKEAYYKMYSF